MKGFTLPSLPDRVHCNSSDQLRSSHIEEVKPLLVQRGERGPSLGLLRASAASGCLRMIRTRHKAAFSVLSSYKHNDFEKQIYLGQEKQYG